MTCSSCSIVIGSAVTSLITFVSVICVGVVFHPSRTGDRSALAELNGHLSCVLCETESYNSDTEDCKKCDIQARISSAADCNLTSGQENSLREMIEKKTKSYSQNIKEALNIYDKSSDRLQQVISDLKTLGQDANLPSALWFPKTVTPAIDNREIVSDWHSTTGDGYAHSMNGITKQVERSGASMQIPLKGWYYIYFQVGFVATKKQRHFSREHMKGRFEASVYIPGNGGVSSIMSRSSSHYHSHTLSGHRVVKLFKGDRIQLSVEKPDGFQMNMDQHETSYLGVAFLRQQKTNE